MEKPDFAAIKNIRERCIAFLEYTMNHYNSNNRAIGPIGTCVYTKTPDSCGCAIGQHTPNPENLYGDVYQCFHLLPEWMREIGSMILKDIQLLHDSPKYWDEKGISKAGVNYAIGIKLLINKKHPK